MNFMGYRVVEEIHYAALYRLLHKTQCFISYECRSNDQYAYIGQKGQYLSASPKKCSYLYVSYYSAIYSSLYMYILKDA
jgi:hypothetical protein